MPPSDGRVGCLLIRLFCSPSIRVNFLDCSNAGSMPGSRGGSEEAPLLALQILPRQYVYQPFQMTDPAGLFGQPANFQDQIHRIADDQMPTALHRLLPFLLSSFPPILLFTRYTRFACTLMPRCPSTSMRGWG
jgi:hypothetical protein